MKKFLKLSIVFLLVVQIFNISFSAKNSTTTISTNIKYFDDGSFAVITVEDFSPVNRASTYTKSGAKTYTAMNADGDVLWKFTVKGTFTVNSGVNATCKSTSYTTSNIASGWSLKSATTNASSNKAIGNATFQHKVLFVVTQTKDCTVTLTCDKNGNLS